MRLLKSSPAVREYYNRRFQYMLIDEYQDTNRPQYELMRMLAGERHNVCAVGDEDQSIYSWRGADIRNILEFEKDFPEAKIIRLEQNYRSTQNILQAASAVVANNVKRKGKNLWTVAPGRHQDRLLRGARWRERSAVRRRLHRALSARSGRAGRERRAPPCSTAPTRSRGCLKKPCGATSLKYHVVGGFSFYERAEIKDMISYLKVIQNPDDSISLLRVINTPARGIGKTTIETLERLALETGLSLWGAIGEAIKRQLLPPRALAALKTFRDLIEDARAMLAGTFAERLAETAEPRRAQPRRSSDRRRADDEATNSSLDDDRLRSDSAFDFGATRDRRSDSVAVGKSGEQSPTDEVEAGRRPRQPAGFRAPGAAASTAEILKFLIDRTGYIKLLEEEDTPEAYSRIENLRELVNAAMDSRDRGETLDQFLDHAALVSDADAYDERAQITLMTLHAAKGWSFRWYFCAAWKKDCSRTRAPSSIPTTSRKSAGFATSA